MRIPQFIRKVVPGFEVIDVKEWLSRGCVEIYVTRKSSNKPRCSVCSGDLGVRRGKYFVKIKTMPLFNLETKICVWRHKYHCSTCGKARAENFDFVSPETPHISREYSWWMGRLCEITSVKQAADFSGNDKSTTWRLDFNQMKRRFQYYKPPKATKISVDEVYARRKKYGGWKESRDKRFFTIVCDLDTRKVIWVSESRSKEALDEYFHIIGKKACEEIEVVAGDQHDPYKASVEENCPNANFVWDRFHIMQSFQMALNEDRQWLHQNVSAGENKRLTRGKFKTLFLKKADRRTKVEQRHLSDVMEENRFFVYLELIKEAMFEVYDSPTELDARRKFVQIKEWLKEGQFYSLSKWWQNLDRGWDTFANYFKYPITSSLSEGINNVIKTVKKRAYGYRNMQYFKLKIMQVCGYLNSKYVPMSF